MRNDIASFLRRRMNVGPTSLPARNARSQRGAGILASVVVVSLIVGMAVVACLFLLNIGITTYYQQKINLVARQAALHAAGLSNWSCYLNRAVSNSTLQQDAETMVSSLITQMGLPQASSVNLTKTGTKITAEIALNNLPLLGPGTFLPSFVSLGRSETVDVTDNQPPGLLTITVDANNSVTVPVYGKFLAGFSNGLLPPDNAPPGTAAFFGFEDFSQFSMTTPPGSQYSETLSTPP